MVSERSRYTSLSRRVLDYITRYRCDRWYTLLKSRHLGYSSGDTVYIVWETGMRNLVTWYQNRWYIRLLTIREHDVG